MDSMGNHAIFYEGRIISALRPPCSACIKRNLPLCNSIIFRVIEIPKPEPCC